MIFGENIGDTIFFSCAESVFYSPSGGLLFWLFHTTKSLAKLGTFEISVITRKRLSTRS